MLVQLFLLSMVKTSGAALDACDGYGDPWDCQLYLMKWTVAACWLIAIVVLISALRVSRISYKEKIISYIIQYKEKIISRKERFISIIFHTSSCKDHVHVI